ncbi:MAG: DUF3102 domain-containing protein [Acetanaerobacterium sp.]
MHPCRPYLYRELERLGQHPQSYHDTVTDLQVMYEQLVPRPAPEESKIKKEGNTMPELTTSATQTATQQAKAMELHQYILAQGRVVGQAMSEIGRSLKEMRDQKLYIELGHETFEAYTDEMLNLKQRQAYNYISIYETYGPKFIDAHADLGISKLILLASVPVLDRDDFLEKNDVSDMSVRELKEITEKYRQTCEQLSLMEQRAGMLESDLDHETLATQDAALREETLKAEKAVLEKKIKELENRPVEVAVSEPSIEDLTVIRKAAEKQAAEKYKADLAAAVTKEQKKAAKEADERVKAAKETAKREAEEALKASLQAVEREKSDALERAQTLEKKLSLGGNPDTALFAHLFEEFQGNFNRLSGIITKISVSDEVTAQKFRLAMRKIMTAALEKMGE